MHKINQLDLNNYLNIAKMIIQSQFIIFQVLKNIKKVYIEITEKIYYETFEKCPGLVYFPLLIYITDLRLGYMQASENIEIFKVKIRQIKRGRVLQIFQKKFETIGLKISWPSIFFGKYSIASSINFSSLFKTYL